MDTIFRSFLVILTIKRVFLFNLRGEVTLVVIKNNKTPNRFILKGFSVIIMKIKT